MESKGERTRTRMVESMLELIQARGYSGTGMNAVVEHAEAPKGSMYFHFPGGKESLGEEAVHLAAERFRRILDEATHEAKAHSEVVRRVVDVLAAMLTESEFQLGCPVSVVTIEMGGHSERLRAACSDAFESWVTMTTAWLRASGHEESRARILATTAVGTIEGAIIMARAQRSVEPLRSVAAVLGDLLDAGVSRTAASR